MKNRKSKYHFEKTSLVTLFILLTLAVASAIFFNHQKKLVGQVSPAREKDATPSPTKATEPPKTAEKRFPYTGVASWYGTGENECVGCTKHYNKDGSYYYRMANGERLDDNKLTVAHRTLPLGTKVRFLRDNGDGNGPMVIATITDRGPYVKGRTWDFSKAVWDALLGGNRGTMTVRWEIVKKEEK